MSGTAASGRRPVPTALKVLRGNPGRRPIPSDPQPQELISLAPPEDLHGEARKVWKRTAPILSYMRVLTRADLDALRDYCEIRQAYKATTPGTAAWEKCLRLAKAFMTEFGMTPASRVKLSVSEKPTNDETHLT